jgi:circadian clock protein KaiB
MNAYTLTLFITGHTPKSELAINTLQTICEQRLSSGYQIIIVDVLEQPEEAEKAKVLATPTLIKQTPLPEQRIIGDLADSERLISILGL